MPVLWDRRVVDVQIVAGEGVGAEDVGGEGIDERLQHRRRRADPAGQEPPLAKAGVEVSRAPPSRAKISALR